MTLTPTRVVALLWSSLILLAAPARGGEVTATFTSAATVPVTAASYTATGNTLNLSLSFAPPTGTNLTVVMNTGTAFIDGMFDNLIQGQRVDLTYNNLTYPFVANYFGGTGNDLVLQWGNTRLLSWGENSSGQLGQDHTSQCLVPTPVVAAGALVGKQILSISVGQFHSLALCGDGSIAAWGSNENGRLGNGTILSSPVPVAVDQTGVLAGKRVIAVSAGANFNLALCADGTLAAWGSNDYSQLGDGTYTSRKVPVAVDLTAGGFAGRKVSAVVAGGMHAVALCTDGTLVAWGYGDGGQLGNGTTSYSSPPVVVTKGAVLTGKTIVSLAAGYAHSMALCSDGTLAAWGSNGWGAVGNNSTTTATTPVEVVKTGVLSGKTLTGIAAGANNSLALCSDSTLATWGINTNGRLGNGSTTYSKVPVAVTRTGVLSGKTVVGVSPWAALCSDGALATWGDNTYGQLGNNSTTHSTTPVLANTSALRSGEKLVEVRSAGNFHLAVVAAPPAPSGTTLAATGVGDRTCTVRGTAIANGQSTTVSFQYGLTAGYGSSVAGTPSPVTGTAPVGVSAGLTGLLPGKTYHYRVVVTSGGGIVYGGDQEFTTTAQVTLAGLVPSVGTLVPVLDPAVSSYSMSVLPTTADITLAPTVAQPGATVTVAGTPVTSGTASGPLALALGNTAIPVVVTAADGVTMMTYTVTVTRPPVVLAFNAAADVPVTAAAFDATGMTATFALGFAPPPGTVLTVVNQTGLEFMRGAFGNLAQGQEVEMAYAGVRYRFIANYFGGTGNDLVLQWANVRLMAWGSNSSGQIGNGGQVWNGSGYMNSNLLVPTAVDASGVLAGKTVMMVAAGGTTSLALCADGTLASWGEGGGRLGNGTTNGAVVPVLVDRSGVLADKTVVSLVVGSAHCLALCADGTVAAWGNNEFGQLGNNEFGQLGNNSTTASTVPVQVDASGVLAGRKVVMIAATGEHNLALCGDGTLVAWGRNNSIGQLGNNSTIDSSVPVLVETGGVLYGRRVVEIAAGGSHSAALCADGTLAVWGSNNYGQLGLGNKTESKVPVALPLTGVLAGKTIRSVSASYYHTMVWGTDGTLAAWGYNASGGLGNNTMIDSLVPVAVVRSGVLSGKTVTRIATGWNGSAALCSDGKMATWGGNNGGQLGNNSTTSSSVPVLVNMTGLRAGERFVQGQMNGINSHSLALVGSVPEPSAVLTLAATATRDKGATLNGSVNANGSTTTVTFEYGLTTAYGTVVSATPATVTGTTATPVSAVIAGLPTGTAFHYRVIAASAGGVVKGEDRQVTTTDQATLAGLAVSVGTLDPGFAPVTTAYAMTVPTATANLTVTPVASHADAAITVNGQPVASGAASEPVALVEGNNVITVGVTSGAGTDTGSYTLRVLRVPQVFRFTSASTVGITVSSLRPAGAEARFELAFAALPGCVLTVVNNTGPAMIAGVFDNLTQGQAVSLSYNGISYPFVANYFGGSGNDLVLQWANTRVFAWGNDTHGELGDNSPGNSGSAVPTPVYRAGVLAGKTVTAIATGGNHSVVLCADGTLASWGKATSGRLGDGSDLDYGEKNLPVAVDRTGVLAGKTVVAVAAGSSHALAVCTDGTLVAWGSNSYGQLGDNSTTNRVSPVLVDRTGVLAGKTVAAVSAGSEHSLALCSDGTLAAWGANSDGQLGNGGTNKRTSPVLVDRTGVLAAKTVSAIAAGDSINLILCTDGTLASWGQGTTGQLGTGGMTSSSVPVLVNRAGVLAGKTVTAVAAGLAAGFAVCSDGTLASWGSNAYGLLGDNSSTNRVNPVLVDRTGVLAGKTVTSLSANLHALVLCSDGTAAAWGYGGNGQLGNNPTTYNANAPVAVATTGFATGERFMTVSDGAGFTFSLGLVASPPQPVVSTLTATAVKDASASLNATVMPNGSSTSVGFEYGLTTAYGATRQAGTVTGTATKSVSQVLGDLPPGATWHYRVVATNSGGTVTGEDMVFTTTTLATLAGLAVDQAAIAPAFDSVRTGYVATVPYAVDGIRVTPVTTHAAATVKVNGAAVESGVASTQVPVAVGNTTIPVVVTSGDLLNTWTYQIVVTRMPETLTFPNAGSVPITTVNFAASGNAPVISLGHAPQTGATLMVVNNTGSGPIRGAFANLADGQRVELEHGGISYAYFVNYAGGTGNDLVLEWGNTRLLSWGDNSSGQLGQGGTGVSRVPASVVMTGVLAGRPVKRVSAAASYSRALCMDGTLAVWGGSGSGSSTFDRTVPAAADLSGVPAGKAVIQVVSSSYANYALCMDGSLLRWSTGFALVTPTGALVGKTLAAIDAGNYHAIGLCTDGTVVAWGTTTQFTNLYGQLGNNSLTDSVDPVAVYTAGALAGKTVKAIAAGSDHSLALCTDGTLVAWGANRSGELGTGAGGSYSAVPVVVSTNGVLAGKTIVAAAAGGHSMALCADGTLATWGNNYYGQLGNNSTSNSLVPVLVSKTGVLAGKTITGLAAGNSHSLAICADGTMAAWGAGGSGELGNNTTVSSPVPVLINTGALRTGERVLSLCSSPGASHSIAIVATPPPPAAATLAADGTTDHRAVLHGSVMPNGSATSVFFEYGRTPVYGSTVAAAPAAVNGGGATAVAADLATLTPGTTYHFRVVAAGPGGTARGEDLTFTTPTLSTLADLMPGEGVLLPAFEARENGYALTVPLATTALTLTPVTAWPGATVKVAGTAVASGTASSALPLGIGNNRIEVEVTAADGSATNLYTVTATRMAGSMELRSATGDALTVPGFTAAGAAPAVSLGFDPPTGTDLTVVNNTGRAWIRGAFSDLVQGQRVVMERNGLFYPFVVDYFGGTGNDLVLHWQGTRLFAIGYGSEGQLGTGRSETISQFAEVVDSGLFASRSLATMANAYYGNLAVCGDGSLVGWGANYYNQLATPATGIIHFPTPLGTPGALAGRTVVGVAMGSTHSLALCSDGALVSWGNNQQGQLGPFATAQSAVPLEIVERGDLTDKRVVAVAATGYASYALADDGTLATWGDNRNTVVPVAFGADTLLAGRKVTAIAASGGHMLALCADGGIVAWGNNTSGQLGNGSKSASSGPVAVNASGVLAGKQVVVIAATANSSFALCADGTLAGWGANNNGELGDGTTVGKLLPLAIHATGALVGKTISKLAAGLVDILAVCSDGTVVRWGGGITGPVVQAVPGLRAGERVTACFAGPAARHRFVGAALPLRATVETLAANAVGDTEATLNAEVLANGGTVAVAFEYGATESYGEWVAALPATVSGSGRQTVSARLTGLRGGTLYHFRVRLTDALGSVRGRDLTFTTGNLAGLSGLAVSAGPLAPSFDTSVTNYSVTVPFTTTSTTVTAQTVQTGATIEVDGEPVASGTASAPIALATGVTAIPVRVTAADGVTAQTYTVRIARVPDAVVWHGVEDVPLSVERFTAEGLQINLGLGFAPLPGTHLTLVRNTGPELIAGQLTSLTHGQRIELTYAGVSYPFLVNYQGGSGNDLVLQWYNTRVMAWGYNNPVPVVVAGGDVFAGRATTAFDATGGHTMLLAHDGTVADWNNGSNPLPKLVDPPGVLAGRRVTRLVAGSYHALALCDDGIVAAWGSGPYGEMGNGTYTSSATPVAVDRSGVLAGRKVIDLAAGEYCGFALCADGTIGAWGLNYYQQLGNKTTIGSAVPVRVYADGVLAARRVIALASGTRHTLGLCDDGALVAWGYNTSGQLGNGGTAASDEPVLVDATGVLAGKTVVAMGAGDSNSYALCSDGTLAAWGSDDYGQLGNGAAGNSPVPVEVDRSGVLAGKTVSAMSAGGSHVVVRCSDGTLAGWGLNSNGQLGNNSTVNSPVPVAMVAAVTENGAKFVFAEGGRVFTTGVVALPPLGAAVTGAATSLADTAATLNATVMPNGSATSVSFEYGLTEAYGTTVVASADNVSGTDPVAVSAVIAGLIPRTNYHFRVVTQAPGGTVRGEDHTFATTSEAFLAALTPDVGVLAPAFESGIADYAITVPAMTASVTLTPVAAQAAATITLNGVEVPSGMPCPPLDLTSGSSFATIAVDAGDGVNSRTYRVTVTRLPAVFAFDAPTTVPATAGRFGVAGMSAVLELRHAPAAGANLTVLHSIGGEPIHGNFANLAHGQIVLLEYQGLVYRFVANYHGGKGNDLILQWADRRVFGWGRNDTNQLPGLTGTQMEAAELDLRAVLTGRTILDAAAGASHMLLLLDNGTIASWGSNSNGQLGHGVSGPGIVDRTGVLAGKTVVQIAAGMQHNLALCSDGTLVAWGNNGSGALGDGTSNQRSRPVVVPQVGALAGRRPLALAAGASSSLVLCTDGTLVAWGSNSSGQLGNGSTTSSAVPVTVEMGGVLNSKEIRSIALANGTCFALCADGTLAAWGSNQYGMVGDNTTVNRSTPVRIDDKGALVGMTVAAVAAGSRHNHALCSDGTLVAWGYDQVGHLGDGGTLYGSQSPVPVLVDRSGVLADKTVTKVAAGDGVAGCLTSDGNLFFWGTNDAGILGIGSSSPSGYSSPVAVKRTNLRADQRFIDIVCSKGWGGSYAFVDGPLAPVAETLAATPVGDASATLRGAIRPNDSQLTVAFEFGLTTSYGTTLTADPGQVDGTAMVPASAVISGLLPATTYHYRVIVTRGTTGYAGGDLAFTTGAGTTLAGLSLDTGTLVPAFEPACLSYGAVVDNGTENVSVTPLPAVAGATVKVNGTPVASGSASQPLPLVEGNNPLTVAVTSVSGETTTNYQIMVTRLPAKFRFNNADEVPVTVERFAPNGLRASFELGFAPVPGTRLTVARCTTGTPVGGVFANLPQGQLVELPFAGRTYRFTANYHGGDGNDLTLEWAIGRMFFWGLGQKVPIPADTSGTLHGATVVQAVASAGHRLLLLGDGSLYAWGVGSSGQLGNGSTVMAKLPQKINGFGALAGRAVITVAAGEYHSLALCADGTLVAWGSNSYGQLGNGADNSQSNLPVQVDRSGVLAGKRILALAATASASFALCEDGSIAAWGKGNLGNGLASASTRPVLVNTSGVLAGKKIVSITGGVGHVMALCADGFLAGWGYNGYGQLGTGNTATGLVPVAVNRGGVLAGKTIVAVAAGDNQTLVLCSDGSMAAWGYNGYNWLGTGSDLNSFSLPLTVIPAGALTGKTVVGIGAGEQHCMALCSDGSVAAWGPNSNGQLGNDSKTDSSTPVAVSQANLLPGERFTALVSCPFDHLSFALTAMSDWLEAATLAASPVSSRGATLHARVDPGAGTVSVVFDYGSTTAYGQTVAADPADLTGSAAVVGASLVGLAPGTTYHYRVRCITPLGTILGEDLPFTTATVATLADLRLSQGVLGPAFAAAVTRYAASVPAAVEAVALTPVAATPGATIEINGSAVASGNASAVIPLAAGPNPFVVKVTSPDGGEMLEYTVVVTRLPERFVFGSATEIPLTAEGFSAAGISPVIGLGFEPPPGSELTLVRNTSGEPIQDALAGLAHGQAVDLDFGANSYRFVADYYGGSGNDLVLRWANTRVVGWGNNGSGQLATGQTLESLFPVATAYGTTPPGRSIRFTVVGSGHGLALDNAGVLEAAGENGYGTLGNGSSTDSLTPVWVDRSGVLAGKSVVAVAAGWNFVLAACADGTLASWGYGQSGELGHGIEGNSQVPVAVDRTGVLAGKRVTALAAGEYHAMALCDDGMIATWGYNGGGALGIGTTTFSYETRPLRVATDGVLAGQRVTAIAAGRAHTVALCSDGKVVAWGVNDQGQVGDNSTTARNAPVAVIASGVLAGKTVTAVAAGGLHSLALCADGTLAAWGDNASGQLGNGSTTASLVPVAVDRSGALAGKTVISLTAGYAYSMVLCSDGSVIGWGSNGNGQLGVRGISSANLPVLANQPFFAPGERIVHLSAGGMSATNLAVLAVPLPTAMTRAAEAPTGTTVRLHGSVNARHNSVTVSFEYGLDEHYGQSAVASPAALSGNRDSAASAALSGLLPGTTYHYRMVASCSGGIARGADLTFTTLSDNALLADLGHNGGTIAPAFAKQRFEYLSSVPFDTTAVTVNAATDHPGATFTVNGGDPATPVALTVGNNRIVVVVTAEDGIATNTYAITVNRLPLEFVFNSASDIPLTSDGFAAGGNPVRVVLGFTPAPGTVLTMVNNTGLGFIYGRFGNLAQGQRIGLRFDGRNYDFIANYHGGTGNDLVLQWATTELLAWGGNGFGQLGDDTTTRRLVPTPVNDAGVLADKPVLAVAGGYLHSLALCADGTLAAWGYNAFGQLGNGLSANSSVPVAVDQTGVLAGKAVVAIAAGPFHNLALCEDGTVVSWGYNNHGQLGDGSKVTRRTPVVVARAGALVGMQVVAVAAGAYQSFALGADGTVAAWGYNDEGELGDGSTTGSPIPVAVDRSGVLAGKQVASLAAGQYHTLALCTDATLVAWGYNNRGQLGNASTTAVASPVTVGGQAALAGRTPVGISAGSYHSLAWCADGTLAGWGANNHGQLGVAVPALSALPLAVDVTGVASGGGIAALAAGGNHSLLRLADGRLAAWGENANGQLGDDSLLSRALPTEVTALTGRIMAVASGAAAQHTLALLALPMPQQVAATALVGTELIAYAFALDPSQPGGGHLPEGRLVAGEYVVRFTQPAAVSDIVYGAEWSATMQPGSWQEVPDTGSGGEHRFVIPVTGAAQGFIRLKVTAAAR